MVGELAVYGFSLLAAIFWAMAGVIAKRGLTRGGTVVLLGSLSAGFGAIVFWGVIVTQRGLEVFHHLTPAMVVIFVLSGIAASGLGRLAHLVGITRVGATISEAGASTHPMFAAIIAMLFIGEPIRAVEFFGMVFIVIGLIIFALSKGGDIRGWQPWELVFPVSAAALFGIGNALRRFGFVATDATPVEGAALNAVAAVLFFAGYVVATNRRDVFSVSRTTYRYMIGAALLIPAGLLSLMTALSLGRVVIVVPLSGTAPLFTVVFSYLLIGDLERVTKGVIVGSVCTVFGIYLLTGG